MTLLEQQINKILNKNYNFSIFHEFRVAAKALRTNLDSSKQ